MSVTGIFTILVKRRLDTRLPLQVLVYRVGKPVEDYGLQCGDTWKKQFMNRLRSISVTLMALVFTPMATAEIFKCDGPDGPIFSDRECGPDAANVEIADTSGLSGVSEETKAELAKRKADRAKAREEDPNLKKNRTVINKYTINAEPAGRWLYPYRAKPERPKPPLVTPRSPPSTLGRPRR